MLGSYLGLSILQRFLTVVHTRRAAGNNDRSMSQEIYHAGPVVMLIDYS